MALIELIDYVHLDYIDDVLTEHFGVECAFLSTSKEFVLFFADNASLEQVKKAVHEINEYHRVNVKEFKVIGIAKDVGQDHALSHSVN